MPDLYVRNVWPRPIYTQKSLPSQQPDLLCESQGTHRWMTIVSYVEADDAGKTTIEFGNFTF